MRRKSKNQTKEWMVYLPDTPIGPLRLCLTDQGLTALEFVGEAASLVPEHDTPPPHLKPLIEAAKRELKAYFEGMPTDFAALALDPQGTPFQRRVWDGIRAIAPRHTRTYGDLAAEIGSAPRAVGQACGANPFPLVIPCHRVV